MKKLSVLLASVLLAMLSLCLFLGCNSNSVEGKYVFESVKFYSQDRGIKGELIEEYHLGDAKDGVILTEDYLVINLHKDGRCNFVYNRRLNNPYLSTSTTPRMWQICYHWKKDAEQDEQLGINDGMYITRGLIEYKGDKTFSCEQDGQYIRHMYMDQGDLIFVTVSDCCYEEARLKRVEKSDEERAREPYIGCYILSALKVGGNYFEISHSTYAAISLQEDGLCTINLGTDIVDMQGTWGVEDGQIVLTGEEPLTLPFKFTVEKNMLYYQIDDSSRQVYKKVNAHSNTQWEEYGLYK